MNKYELDIEKFLPPLDQKEEAHQVKAIQAQRTAAPDDLQADLEHAIQGLESTGRDITADYGDWVKLAFAFASIGETGRPYFHRISRSYASYDHAECDKQFDISIKKHDGRTNIATFFQYCKDAGVSISTRAEGRIPIAPLAAAPRPPLQPVQDATAPPEVDVQDLLNESEIDFSEELAPPPVCLEIVQESGSAIIGTRGNFSLIIGKAKSRKTFFITIALAAAVSNNVVLDIFKGSLPADKNMVLFFDTEQGRYHVQKAARRVLHLSGIPVPDNFKAFGLRKHKPQERLQLIEKALYSTPNLGMVVIDGVRDLVSSINDEELATMLASKLLKWTEELDIHIICVLHQNKGDNNARGHIGTELQNKAETVLSVTKDAKNKEISIVEAEYCREKEFEPFAFDIDLYGIPQLIESWSPKHSARFDKKPSDLPADIPISTHCEVLKLTFLEEDQLMRSQLLLKIKYALSKHGIGVGDNKVKDYITFYTSENLISQHGTVGTKSSHYKLNLNRVN